MGFDQFNESTALNSCFQFLPASGTATATLTVNSLFTQRIDSAMASNSDSIDHVVDLIVTGPGGNFHMGSVLVPAGAGHLGTKAVDVFAGAWPATIPYIILSPGWQLSAAMEVAINTAKEVCVFLQGGYF